MLCARHEGFDAELASNATQAIEHCANDSFDVVVAALQMDPPDGLSLIGRLRRDSPDSAFLLVTADPQFELPANDVESRRVDGIVQKPWTLDTLGPALRQAETLSRRRSAGHDRPLQGRNTQVLIIEDDEADALLIARHLAEATSSYEVTVRHRLGDGLNTSNTQSFDVALVDLSLPDARGLDSVTRLRTAKPELPIVVLSGLDDQAVEAEALEAGAQDYLSKAEIGTRTLHRSIRYAIQRKGNEERLSYVAKHDALTGLPNRSLFIDRLERAVAVAEQTKSKMGVLFLDLDGFKKINDTMSHESGDLLLVDVARRLKSCLRGHEVTARLGGDEFTVLLENLQSAQDIVPVVTRLIEAIGRPFQLKGAKAQIGSSIGVAFYPQDARTATELLKCADQAMYRAKACGKNTYRLYSDEAQNRVVTRLQLEEALKTGVSKKEFELHYQPQMKADTMKIASVEALLRWNRPGLELQSPGPLLSLLEESRLVIPMTRWILNKAVRQLQSCEKLNEAAVSVNIPASLVDQPQLIDIVLDCLRETGLDPSRLELELTEESLIRDNDGTRAVLQRLRREGVRIALDDFGSGFSSLWYLDRFPIDVLKIDRHLVRDAAKDSNRAALFAAILELAHDQQIEVVADGVETLEHLGASKGCDRYQGFFFCHPLPATVLPDWTPRTAPPPTSPLAKVTAVH